MATRSEVNTRRIDDTQHGAITLSYAKALVLHCSNPLRTRNKGALNWESAMTIGKPSTHLLARGEGDRGQPINASTKTAQIYVR